MKSRAKTRAKQAITLLTLGCFLFAGCTAPGTNEQVQGDAAGENQNRLYRVIPSNRTTNQWENVYGVISHDGRMILPIENQDVYIIEDSATGEQLWVQTRKQIVEDPTLTAEELWEDDNWEKIHNEYTLYDLEGNLLKELGANGVQRVCDNLVLYYNQQLTDRENGEVYFDDVHSINKAGDYYVMNVNNYNGARVIDKDMNIVYETDGGFIGINDQYYISAEIRQVDGKRLCGLYDLNGNEIIPCEYEYFYSSDIVDVPYVKAQRDNREFVISLADGRIVYQESNVFPEYDYIQYLLKDCMIIQTRETVATAEKGGWPIYQYSTAMYDYEGNIISDKYNYLSPQMGLYNMALSEGKEAEMLFSATTMDGTDLIINADEEVLFTLEDGWMTLLSEDRMIIHDNNGNGACLCDMAGNQINEKEYEYMHTLYMESTDGMYSQSRLINASYTLAGKNMCDLVDSDGNILIERAKNIQALSPDRFWVEKGFSQGLMDAKGNWIYEESVFQSAADE